MSGLTPGQPSGERPWTEAEWERFMSEHREQATRAAAAERSDAEILHQLGLTAGDQATDESRADFGDEGDAQIRYIPAFQLAQQFAAGVRSAQSQAGTADSGQRIVNHYWTDLAAEAHRIARSIASGHGLGYEDSHICGNIVKCREALSHVERSIALLDRLRGSTNGAAVDGLMGTAVFVRAAVQERIEALRRRVWWDDRRGG